MPNVLDKLGNIVGNVGAGGGVFDNAGNSIGNVSGGSAFDFNGNWLGDLDVSDSGGAEGLLAILLLGLLAIFGTVIYIAFKVILKTIYRFLKFLYVTRDHPKAIRIRHTLLRWSLLAFVDTTSLVLLLVLSFNYLPEKCENWNNTVVACSQNIDLITHIWIPINIITAIFIVAAFVISRVIKHREVK